MRPAARAILGGALALFALGELSPRLAQTLAQARAEERVEPGVLELASAISSARRSLLPEGAEAARAATLLRQAAVERAVEQGWTARAAVVLDPQQRIDPGPPPELPRSRRAPWLDPELAALIETLGATHGHTAAALPDAPPFDPWPGVEPRRRAYALRLIAPDLRPDQAQAIEALALDAAVASSRRAAAESALRALLDPSILSAAATASPEPDRVYSAAAALDARAR